MSSIPQAWKKAVGLWPESPSTSKTLPTDLDKLVTQLKLVRKASEMPGISELLKGTLDS